MQRIIILYIIFLLIFTSFSYLFVDFNLIYLKDFYTGFYTEHRNWTSFFYILLLFFQFVFYLIFLKNIKKVSINLKFIIFVTSLILFFSYPAMLSYDIFNYVLTSKVLFGYHENPYILTPIELTGEPWIEFTRATNKVALYGPAWTFISGIPFVLGFGNFLLTLFGFKLISLLSYIGASFLIFKITKNTFSTVLFALNPLVVTESLISGHNDIFMMLFALLSFSLLSSGKKLRSILSLIISILVKYATIFLVPVYLYSFWQKIKNRSENLNLTYLVATISMLIIFSLSAFREEIYPWYGIWFLAFASTIPHKRSLLYLSMGLSVGLMLSYLPFMVSGTYFGSTPYIKYALIIIPTLFALFLGLKRRVWLKNFFWQ